MKKFILFPFIALTLIASGCGASGQNPQKINIPPGQTQQTKIENNQMISARFREPFDLKFGQTAQIEGTDIHITPLKIVTLPCGQCDVNYGFQATFEIHRDGQTSTIDISDRKATILGDFSVIISKFTPQVPDSFTVPDPSTLPDPADYTLTMLVQDIPTTSPPPTQVKPGFPFTLKLDGQSATIKKELGFSSDDLQVKAKKVTEDSRCPSAQPPAMVNCAWSGQVVVLLEIQKGDEVPTLLKVSTIEPATFDGVALVLNHVDPPLLAKDSTNGGIETVSIAPSDYVFHFEIKKASDLPLKPQPPTKLDSQKLIDQAQKIYDEAKTFFPQNGVVFFVDNNDGKNHRIALDFDASTIMYTQTLGMLPYVSNGGAHLWDSKVKITDQDLQKIKQMADNQPDNIDLDINFLIQEGSFNLHGTSIVVVQNGEPLTFSQSDTPSPEMKNLYNYVRDFTSID